MKKRVVLLSLLAMILCSSAAMAFSIMGTVTGGNPVGFPPHLKYVVAVPLASGTTNFLSNLALANITTGSYTINNVDSGSYVMAAFQDMNINFLPDLDEPRGFWMVDTSLGIPTIMNLVHDTSGINIRLSPANSGGFTGTFTYSGQQRGRTYVVASRDSLFRAQNGFGTSLDTTTTGNGSYTAITDTFGVYWAYAYLDANGNALPDSGEPFGYYGGAHPVSISVLQGHDPTNINFTLLDSPAAIAAHPSLILSPSSFILSAYPNPFNSSIRIPFSLSRTERIEMALYDVTGRKVRDITGGTYPQGISEIIFSPVGLSSGTYFIHLMPPDAPSSQKIILIR